MFKNRNTYSSQTINFNLYYGKQNPFQCCCHMDLTWPTPKTERNHQVTGLFGFAANWSRSTHTEKVHLSASGTPKISTYISIWFVEINSSIKGILTRLKFITTFACTVENFFLNVVYAPFASAACFEKLLTKKVCIWISNSYTFRKVLNIK